MDNGDEPLKRRNMIIEFIASWSKAWVGIVAFGITWLGFFGLDYYNIATSDWRILSLAVGLVVAAMLSSYQIFQTQQRRIHEREIDLVELRESAKSTKPNIRLKLRDCGTGLGGDVAPGLEDFTRDGRPRTVHVWIQVQAENLGKEIGVLLVRLVVDRCEFPSKVLRFSKDRTRLDRFAVKPTVVGRTNHLWRIHFDIVPEDALLLAKQLHELDRFRIVLEYQTDRVGEPSPPQELVAEGDFDGLRRVLIKFWSDSPMWRHPAETAKSV